jgi:hypothetical protein
MRDYFVVAVFKACVLALVGRIDVEDFMQQRRSYATLAADAVVMLRLHP